MKEFYKGDAIGIYYPTSFIKFLKSENTRQLAPPYEKLEEIIRVEYFPSFNIVIRFHYKIEGNGHPRSRTEVEYHGTEEAKNALLRRIQNFEEATKNLKNHQNNQNNIESTTYSRPT